MIKAEQLGKQYNSLWLFRHLSCTITPGTPAAILGPNGSGKSTFLKMIMGLSDPTEGKIRVLSGEKEIGAEHFRSLYSFAAPYSGLFEELSVRENIALYSRFKPLKKNLSTEQVLQTSGLKEQEKYRFHQLSSGMKQRLRLTLALLSETDFLFLDEPVSHLDYDSVRWFLSLFSEHSSGRTVLIATNQNTDELSLCREKIVITDYKK